MASASGEMTIRRPVDGQAGLILAMLCALAPLPRSNIPAGCREPTISDGFGAIDASRLVLYRTERRTSDAIEGMANAIREAFRTE